MRYEAPSVRQDARWEFSLSSDLMCFPRIQSRDFTDVPSDEELIFQVTTNSSLVRQGEFDFYPQSNTTLFSEENRYFRHLDDFLSFVTEGFA